MSQDIDQQPPVTWQFNEEDHEIRSIDILDQDRDSSMDAEISDAFLAPTLERRKKRRPSPAANGNSEFNIKSDSSAPNEQSPHTLNPGSKRKFVSTEDDSQWKISTSVDSSNGFRFSRPISRVEDTNSTSVTAAPQSLNPVSEKQIHGDHSPRKRNALEPSMRHPYYFASARLTSLPESTNISMTSPNKRKDAHQSQKSHEKFDAEEQFPDIYPLTSGKRINIERRGSKRKSMRRPVKMHELGNKNEGEDIDQITPANAHLDSTSLPDSTNTSVTSPNKQDTEEGGPANVHLGSTSLSESADTGDTSPNKREHGYQSQKGHEKISVEEQLPKGYPPAGGGRVNIERKNSKRKSTIHPVNMHEPWSKNEVKDIKQNTPTHAHIGSTPLDSSVVGEQPSHTATMDSQNGPSRPSRRQRAIVSYAEPNLRGKMRRSTNEFVDAVTAGGQRRASDIRTNEGQDEMLARASLE